MKIEEVKKNLLKSIGENPNIVLFVGNGISEGRRRRRYLYPIDEPSKLSTKKIVKSFLTNISESNPRKFQPIKDAVSDVYGAIEGSDELNMTKFMEGISQIEDMKDSFVNYVIEMCCEEYPNTNHLFLLKFCAVLNSLKEKEPKIVIFTTNYDNLLERAYLKEEDYGDALPIDIEYLIDRFSDRRTREFKKFIKPRIKNSNKNEIKEEARKVALDIKNHVLMPSFYLDKEKVKDCPYNKIPIIPIHGCIRICKCPECERILYTEAAAIGKKRCVYCGSEIPNVVVPTTEGETDKDILMLLEEYIKNAGTVIFIGYGFGDPHIADRLKHGIENSKISTIVNCSLDPINRKDDLGKIQVHDLNTEISTSLKQLIDMLKCDVDEIGDFIINYEDIYEGIYEGIYEDIPDH